jgi:N-acetylneuraminic acid mutarotase
MSFLLGWSETGDMKYGRYRHKASVLKNGKVLVTGGWGPDVGTKSTELYNPLKGTWTTTDDMNNGRCDHAQSVLKNGKVLVTGGFNSTNCLTSAELYDPSTRTWTKTGDMHFTRSSHTSTVLSDGKVLVTGGWTVQDDLNLTGPVNVNSAELYDPKNGTWTTTSQMNYKRSDHTASLLKNGMVLVTGGSKDSAVNDFLYTAELYDLSTESWK